MCPSMSFVAGWLFAASRGLGLFLSNVALFVISAGDVVESALLMAAVGLSTRARSGAL